LRQRGKKGKRLYVSFSNFDTITQQNSLKNHKKEPYFSSIIEDDVSSLQAPTVASE